MKDKHLAIIMVFFVCATLMTFVCHEFLLVGVTDREAMLYGVMGGIFLGGIFTIIITLIALLFKQLFKS